MVAALSPPRAELVAVAARAFASRGYHGVSVRDLARDLGRSPATFYSHFESKEALLYWLQEDAFDTLLASAREAVRARTTPEERLHAFILAHVRYFTAKPDVMRILIHEAATLPPKRREAIRRRKEAYYGVAKEIVASLLGEDDVDAAEVERATYCAFGMLNWIYAWYVPAEHGTAEEVARTIHRIAMRGLASGARKP
jgi:AcrR family transcriptional regulator